MKEAFQEVVSISLTRTKEGEVAILRRIIEKVCIRLSLGPAVYNFVLQAAQDTGAQVAKEEADAKLVQARWEMEKNMERMRTQATFKVVFSFIPDNLSRFDPAD